MALALLSLGSNLGDRRGILQAALEALSTSLGIELLDTSACHETRPIGGPAGQGTFLNAAAVVETSLPPAELLARLQRIEYHLGRKREVPWAARTLDLDLLLYDKLAVNLPGLSLPHPRMAFRRFVLESAVEVAPDMLHPRIGWTVRELWAHLNDALPYVAITNISGDYHRQLAAQLSDQLSARWLGGSKMEIVREIQGGAKESVEFLLLRQSVRELSALEWPEPPPLTITSYWFDQYVPYVALTLEPHELPSFLAEWRAARPALTKPKLVLWLDAPTAWYMEQEETPGAEFLDRFRQGLQLQLQQPDVGPWLQLDARDLAAATEEAVAAIEAMH